MIRRSFRIGLMVGLLGGLAFALAKMLGSRPSQQADVAPAPTDPWPPLRDDLATPVAPRAAPTTPPATAPTAVVTDTVAEPFATPSPAAANPAPAAKPAKAASAPKPAKAAPAAKTPKAAKAAKTTRSAKAAKSATASASRKKALTARWVAPTGDVCPTSHPVKAKLASKIFHLPGMLNYDRTKPDRCYLDGRSAEADGLRAAKR